MDRADINRRFGRLLARCRNRAGISQDDLAQAIGLTRTSVTNIERGRQPVQLPTLYLIAEKLGVELVDLLPAPPKSNVNMPVEGAQVGNLSARTSEWLQKITNMAVTDKVEVTDGQHPAKSK